MSDNSGNISSRNKGGDNIMADAENSERLVNMKKYKVAALIAGMIVLLLAFFPYTIRNVVSGDSESRK